MLLKNRVALITGGAKGMGSAMAVKFAEEGCSVAIADISEKEANETLVKVMEHGNDGIAIKCDVTDEEQVKSTVDQVLSNFVKLDILVNNAGGLTASPPIEEMSTYDWEKSLDLNLKSDFLFCKYVVPHMKQKKFGKIINISSMGAIQPPHHSINYNTAKSGIIGFTYDLANALAPFNINVNAILPGPIRTSFYDKITESMNEKEIEEFFAFLGTEVPLGRVGTGEDIAGAVLFLASELSSFITGETLNVSGGIPLKPLGGELG